MILNTIIELVKRLYATIKSAWLALFNLRNNPKKEEHSEERNNPEKEEHSEEKSIKETVTWYHGTNSHALIQMLASDKRLWSTGSLLKQGRYPLTGELKVGVGVLGLKKGINCLGNISGSPSFELPWRYTKMKPQNEILTGGFNESLRKRYEDLVRNTSFNGVKKKASYVSILFYRFAHHFTVSRYQRAMLGQNTDSEYTNIINEFLLKDDVFGINLLEVFKSLIDEVHKGLGYEKLLERFPQNYQELIKDYNKTKRFPKKDEFEELLYSMDYETPGFCENIFCSLLYYRQLGEDAKRQADKLFAQIKSFYADMVETKKRFNAELPQPLQSEVLDVISKPAIPVVLGCAVSDSSQTMSGYNADEGSETLVKDEEYPLVLGDKIKAVYTTQEGRGQLIEMLAKHKVQLPVFIAEEQAITRVSL